MSSARNRGEYPLNKDSMEFVVYMIHACAERWDMTPKQVYHLLNSSGCINQYLVPYYDVLHTQGSGYLVDDIQQFLQLRGVSS